MRLDDLRWPPAVCAALPAALAAAGVVNARERTDARSPAAAYTIEWPEDPTTEDGCAAYLSARRDGDVPPVPLGPLRERPPDGSDRNLGPLGRRRDQYRQFSVTPAYALRFGPGSKKRPPNALMRTFALNVSSNRLLIATNGVTANDPDVYS